MSAVDFSRPLATLLRESTRKAHETVENSPGATAMLGGKLSVDEYIRYLMMLWHIYDTFERALDRHAAHPSLEPTYNPTLLARAPSLAADISYLLQVPESTWKSHPAHVELMNTNPAPLVAYVSRIEELANAEDPSPLLAHSYVRYLGDLSGGQTIRHTVSKAYGLDEAAGLGLSFYAFKSLRSQNPANQGEMKRIKEWFRGGLNTAGDSGVTVKASVVDEANNAFDLNTALFSAIQTTPVMGVESSNEVLRKGTNAISQVATAMLALFLAHLMLVVGSEYTGTTGCWGLLTLQNSVSMLLG